MNDYDVKSFDTVDDVHAFFSSQEKNDQWHRIYTSEIEAVPLENNRLNLFISGAFKHTCADGFVISGFEPDVTENDIITSMDTTKMSVAISNRTTKVLYPLRHTAFGHIQDRAGVSGRSINALKDKSRAKEMSPATRCKCLNSGLKLYKDYTLVLVRDGKVTALLSGDGNDYAIMPTVRLIKILEAELINAFNDFQFLGGRTTHEVTSIQYKINDPVLESTIVNMLQSYGMTVSQVTIAVQLTTSDVGLSAARLTPMLCIDGKQFIAFGQSLCVEHKGGDKAMTLFVDIAHRFLASFRDNTNNITRLMNVQIKSPGRCLRNVYDALKMKGYSYELRECCERIDAEHHTYCSAFDIYWYLNEMLLAYGENRKLKGSAVSPLDSIKAQENISQVLFMDISAFDE